MNKFQVITFNEIVAAIDRATEPNQMALHQAKHFLEQLSTEIDTRLDGIKDNLKSAVSGEKG